MILASSVWEEPANRVLAAELWNPQTRNWTVLSSMQEPRTYHSVALLLPDGRVLIAGSGQGGGPSIPSNTRMQLFSPPYLFKGARPQISAGPSSLRYGTSFQISSPEAASISSVSLIRLGATTHAFDESQRFNRLAITGNANGTLTVKAPANANLATPGPYMLFILNNNGVPSVAKMVQLN